MNFLSVLSCLCLALTSAAAQAPKPCVSPELMTGSFTLMDAGGLYVSTGAVSYDALGQRMRVRNIPLVGNQTFKMDLLILFNEKVYYEIDWSKLSCKKKALDTTFIPMQVPSDAKLMGQVFMGSSSYWGAGVLTNTWYGELPQNGQYSAVFTEIGCVPVTWSIYTPASGWVALSTYNWVFGNTNPMDYSPPFFCGQSELEAIEKPDTFFAALQSLAKQTKEHEKTSGASH
ncbi:ependymin [Gasterosteus aculeatus]